MNKFVLIGASPFVLLTSSPVVAQGASPDDIIVTATKREQTLQDVPISVSVTSSQTVERAQIRDLIDLQSVVPSLKVTQFNASGQVNFQLRGFGNGNGNDGIESSVGVFIDGVYRSRSAAALDDLPEIERVEVLRGPQSTLFGKNVSAGAISIVTKKPQYEFGAKGEITLGNFGNVNPRMTITGPVSDSIAMRLSGNLSERDGYFRNSTTGKSVNDRNRWSVRGDVLWQPSADFSVRVIGDYNLIRERCCGVTSLVNGDQTRAIGPATPPLPNNRYGINLGFAITNPARPFDRALVDNLVPANRVRGQGLSAQIDWTIGFARLTSITAYRDQVNQSDQDIDYTGADIVRNVTANRIGTFTQEFRLASDGKGPLTWLVGGFFQDEKLDSGRDISYGRDARAYVNAITGNLVTALESLQRVTNPAIVPGQTYFAAGQAISDRYRLNQRSFSLFGQADFQVTDRLTLTGGLAYLNDRKATTSHVVLSDKFAALNLESAFTVNPATGQSFIPFALLPPGLSGCLLQKGFNPASTGGTAPLNLFGASLGAALPGPGSAPCPPSLGGVNPFALNGAQFFYGNTANHAPVDIPNATESGVITGGKLTYAARIAYDFGAVNAYLSYATGWKASAVNLSSDSRPPGLGVGRSADPENVTVYEAGVKAKFRGGFVTLAVFKQSIRGFQSNQFTGTGYTLINAGQESVRGFEIDTAYRPFAWLQLAGGATYLNGRYDSFKGATCVNYDSVRCPVSPLTGRIPATRDLTGEKPSAIPEWSTTASATLSHDFGGGLGGYIRGEYDYTSNTYLTESTPRALATWGVSMINASAALSDANAQVDVMFWVRNLTNDIYLQATFPTTIQDGDGSYSGYPNQPRTYGVTVRKTF